MVKGSNIERSLWVTGAGFKQTQFQTGFFFLLLASNEQLALAQSSQKPHPPAV